ncbi:MAG TPA: hypothetical protein VGB87_18980 [Vicinamibacteria bacterium]
MSWPGAPTALLEQEGLAFRPLDAVLGEEGTAAADAAARTWARVWGRLPLADGKSFRELVEWRGASLLWSATAFLLEETAGPRCARTAERALQLLEATGAVEVDAVGLEASDALLLSRACTVRGVLFHGRVASPGRPLPVARKAARSGLGRFLAGALLPGTPPPLPDPAAGAGLDGPPVLALVEPGRDDLLLLLEGVSASLGQPVVAVSLDELPRWETRRARRAIGEAEALLRGCHRALVGTPGLAASCAHRGVGFADLAGSDLEALALGALVAAARRIEAARELLAAARPSAVLLAVGGRDERRSLVHAASSVGLGVVALRGRGDADRADGGPQPASACEWEPGQGAGVVADALGEAARGRVEAG